MGKREQDWLTWNMIELAKDHKKHCKGEACNISLTSLLVLLNVAKIQLIKKQKEAFLK